MKPQYEMILKRWGYLKQIHRTFSLVLSVVFVGLKVPHVEQNPIDGITLFSRLYLRLSSCYRKVATGISLHFWYVVESFAVQLQSRISEFQTKLQASSYLSRRVASSLLQSVWLVGQQSRKLMLMLTLIVYQIQIYKYETSRIDERVMKSDVVPKQTRPKLS